MPRKAAKSGELRRVPTQERSKRRLETIVEVAGRLFAGEGFAATTMERIAAEAGTSIGSVYQFFPNKRAVFKAVALACLEQSDATFARLLGGDAFTRPWTELIDTVIDGFVELAAVDPKFRALWRNIHLYEEYAAEDEALLRGFASQTASLLGLWLPQMDMAQRRNVAVVMIQTIAALLFTAGRGDAAPPDGLIEETKVMLRRYLEPYVVASGGEKPV